MGPGTRHEGRGRHQSGNDPSGEELVPVVQPLPAQQFKKGHGVQG